VNPNSNDINNDVSNLMMSQNQNQNGNYMGGFHLQPQELTTPHSLDARNINSMNNTVGEEISSGKEEQSKRSGSSGASNKVKGKGTSNSSPTSNGPTEEELYQRRKAQNRAAQRAFRERKEGKLKELSGKLKDAEVEREKLEKILNELKQKNQQLDMENKLLQKQRSQSQQGNSSNILDNSLTASMNKSPFTTNSTVEESSEKVLLFKFPNTTKCDFIAGTIDWSRHGRGDDSALEASKFGHSYEIENEKVLTISAVWDYLVEFTALNDDYELDIPGIMDELRGKEKCHGFGPAYPISLINSIIMNHIDCDY
jgi:AP-1-like transcription factor